MYRQVAQQTEREYLQEEFARRGFHLEQTTHEFLKQENAAFREQKREEKFERHLIPSQDQYKSADAEYWNERIKAIAECEIDYYGEERARRFANFHLSSAQPVEELQRVYSDYCVHLRKVAKKILEILAELDSLRLAERTRQRPATLADFGLHQVERKGLWRVKRKWKNY
jgi:hypothetical protein